MGRKTLPFVQSLVFMLILALLIGSINNQLCFADTISPTYGANSEYSEYLVECGDVLEIAVWGHKDLSDVVTVSEDGKISLTALHEGMRIIGLTLSQVEAALTDKLAYYLKNPRVTVILREAKMVRVTVIGCVRSPGVYSFRAKPTLIDALASAGGPTPEADLTRVRLTRIASPSSVDSIKSDSIVVNVDQVLTREEDSLEYNNVILQDGDGIYVPEKARTVSVLGEVQRPGVYAVDTVGTETRVFDVIAAAGGPGINADTSCIRVTRYTEKGAHTIEIDLDTLGATESGHSSSSGQYDGTFKLLPGDVVYVPRGIRVQVLGQVRNPGSYQLKTKSTVTHAIAQAGGLVESADTSCISLHRDIGEEIRVHVFDLDAAMSGKVPRDKLILQDQDTIFVPELICEVSVLGAVNRPGVYKINKDTRVLQALSLAGWVTRDGDGASAVLTRRLPSGETQRLPVNLQKLQSATDEEENYLLNDGDTIFVPELIREVSVLGSIAHPGIYKIRDDTTLLECLAQAGGITEMGDATSIRLTRRSLDGTFITYTINLEKPHDTIDAKKWIVVNGDSIYVPRR